MDPYAVIICRTQEQKSSVASRGKGTTPEWNETFAFTLSDSVEEIKVKIMDSDNFSEDDFVGEAIILLGPSFVEGSTPPTAYNVVKDQEFRGEVRVGWSDFHSPERL